MSDEGAKRAVDALVRGFFAHASRHLDPADPDQLVLVLAKSTLLFFRLLVAELARRTGALPTNSAILPTGNRRRTDLWDSWERFFASLDASLHPGEREPQQSSLRLFEPDPFFQRYCPGDESLSMALEAARSLTEASPYETISGAYEHLLTHEPVLAETGSPILQPSRSQRRAAGSFYTPLPLARLIVEETLRPVVGELRQVCRQSPARLTRTEPGTYRAIETSCTDGSSPAGPPLPKILDPAMGTGAFLLVAARCLHNALVGVPFPARPDTSPTAPGMTLAAVAEACLHGVDLDPLAVQLAIHALWLETGARPAILARHLRAGNLLVESLDDRPVTYDAVVGNPPWGPETNGTREQIGRKRAGRESVDRFKLFLRLGAAHSRGMIGMIVPQAVLAQATHTDMRALLLARFDPYTLIDLGNNAFPAAAPACALIFGPKPGPSRVRYARLHGPSTVPAWSLIPCSQCGEDGFLLARADVLELCSRLRQCHPTLRDMADHLRIRDVGINYSRAAVARRVLYSGPEPDDLRDLPRYRGRDFDRYTPVHRGGWLRHDAAAQLREGEHLSLSWPTYRLPQKIVLRQTADRLVTTLDCSRMAMGRSVIALTAEREVSLRAVLACLNSRLLTVLYRVLAGEEGRLFPQVKVGRLLALPIPDVCAASLPSGLVHEAARIVTTVRSDGDTYLLQRASDDPVFAWAALDQLAAHLLQAEGQDEKIDTLIDQVVYRLYGLARSEMEIVESTYSLKARE